MTRKPTLNCLPSWVLLPMLPAPTSLQVICPVHPILRGLPSFTFSWAPQPASLPVSDGKLFITLPFLVCSLSVWTHGFVCGWYSWCWTCGLSCSRRGIDDLPGNLSHNPGSSPNKQGPAQSSLLLSSFKTYTVIKQSHSWTCRISAEL